MFFFILLMVSCSHPFAEQKGEGANAIPYPLEKWKGVQGKTLVDSKPDFIGQRKAP
jgi:arylsulfatase